MSTLPDPLVIDRVAAPLDVEVVLPGSKSISNRALICAALASGSTLIDGLLDAEDTRAMIECLTELGATIRQHNATTTEVVGVGGHPAPGRHRLLVRESGTTARFVTPVCALGSGTYDVDAAPSMRARPMRATFDALRSMGVEVSDTDGHLPAGIVTSGVEHASLDLSSSAGTSSQFVSGLLLAGGAMTGGLSIVVGPRPVSATYLDMTVAVMRSFGATVAAGATGAEFRVGGGYRSLARYQVEPDASAASYFFAAAAVCGGRVRVSGLGSTSLQGDARFVGVLAAMGAEVEVGTDFIEVRSDGRLRGVTVDMSDLSDTAQTLAAIAPFAHGPTEVTGIGFIRGKETDRIAAVVTELVRCGVDARETPDGFVIQPGVPVPTLIRTYNDHRMAMSFAVMGLAADGISIADPGCVSKTFPGFWDTLATVRP